MPALPMPNARTLPVIARTWRVIARNFIEIAPDYYFKEGKFIKIRGI